jgi:hypothetical protein
MEFVAGEGARFRPHWTRDDFGMIRVFSTDKTEAIGAGALPVLDSGLELQGGPDSLSTFQILAES